MLEVFSGFGYPCADVVDVLAAAPDVGASCVDRAGWLFDLADALEAAGRYFDAGEAREWAYELVGSLVDGVAWDGEDL